MTGRGAFPLPSGALFTGKQLPEKCLQHSHTDHLLGLKLTEYLTAFLGNPTVFAYLKNTFPAFFFFFLWDFNKTKIPCQISCCEYIIFHFFPSNVCQYYIKSLSPVLILNFRWKKDQD